MYKGEALSRASIKILRPCPKNSIDPFNIEKYFGKKIKKKIKKNDLITSKCFQ
jgi:sialic acid synthase SpsE